jgi:DNA repair exonuclease SbcCD ATPase subunit
MGIWQKLFGKRETGPERPPSKISPELRVIRTPEEKKQALSDLDQLAADARRMSKDLDALNQSNEEEIKKLAILKRESQDMAKASDERAKASDERAKASDERAKASDELLKRLRSLTKSDPEYARKLAAIKQEFNALREGSNKPGNA